MLLLYGVACSLNLGFAELYCTTQTTCSLCQASDEDFSVKSGSEPRRLNVYCIKPVFMLDPSRNTNVIVFICVALAACLELKRCLAAFVIATAGFAHYDITRGWLHAVVLNGFLLSDRRTASWESGPLLGIWDMGEKALRNYSKEPFGFLKLACCSFSGKLIPRPEWSVLCVWALVYRCTRLLVFWEIGGHVWRSEVKG